VVRRTFRAAQRKPLQRKGCGAPGSLVPQRF
jgi:hypothetical protein